MGAGDFIKYSCHYEHLLWDRHVQSASHEFFSSSPLAYKRKLKFGEGPSPAAAVGYPPLRWLMGRGALARGSGAGYTSWMCGPFKSISLPWPQFPSQ